MSQPVSILAARPEGFGLIPGSHMVEQENQLALIILIATLMPWHVYTHINKIKINVIFLREGWDGKLVQWLTALAVPPGDQVPARHPHGGSQSPGTTVPEDHTLFSVPCRHQGCTRCTEVHGVACLFVGKQSLLWPQHPHQVDYKSPVTQSQGI